MTLDEAIKHAEEVAERNFNNAVYIMDKMDKTKSHIAISNVERCKRCAEEHRQLAEWLKELKQLREQTRWIPVNERLPEIGQYVLCSLIKAEDVKHRVIICKYERAVWWSYVTAWMPLPEPYKAESEGKE